MASRHHCSGWGTLTKLTSPSQVTGEREHGPTAANVKNATRAEAETQNTKSIPACRKSQNLYRRKHVAEEEEDEPSLPKTQPLPLNLTSPQRKFTTADCERAISKSRSELQICVWIRPLCVCRSLRLQKNNKRKKRTKQRWGFTQRPHHRLTSTARVQLSCCTEAQKRQKALPAKLKLIHVSYLTLIMFHPRCYGWPNIRVQGAV